MKFKGKLQHIIFILLLTLFVGFTLASTMMNMVFYAGVLAVNLQYIGIMMIIPVVVIHKMKSYSLRTTSIFAIVLLGLCLIQFLNLPTYTYLEAQNHLEKSWLDQDQNIDWIKSRRDSINTGTPVTKYIDEYYYFEAKKNNQLVKIIVNPMTLSYDYQ